MKEVKRVYAVDHFDVMAHVREAMTQPVQVHGVTAETVRRIKRSKVQEIQGADHWDGDTFDVPVILKGAEAALAKFDVTQKTAARVRAVPADDGSATPPGASQ